MDVFGKKRKRRRRSDRGELKAKVEAAKDKASKSIDFQYEDASEVLDITLEELKRTSKESLEKMESATSKLKELSGLRVPAPGPTEKAG